MFGGGAFPPSPLTGYPVGLNAAKTCFLDQNGNPTFACGDAPQYAVEILSPSDLKTYWADRSARGVNLVWNILVDATATTNYNGDAPFSGTRFTNFQTAYWNYVDYQADQALLNGATILMMPAFMGLNTAQGDDLDAWKASSDATLQAYAAFLGARYGSRRNIMWVLGGDADPFDTALYAKLNTFGVALKAAAPNQLFTLEASRFTNGSAAPNGGYSSTEALTAALGSVPSWLDFNWNYQPAASCGTGAQRCYRQSGIPNLMGEDWYELEHSMTAQGLRSEGYAAILGGCTLGRLFGNGVIWPFNAFGISSPSWQSQLTSQGSADQQRLGQLLRSRRHQLLVPDIAGSVMTASTGGFCGRDSEGKNILAYLPSSQTATIDMSKITDAGSLANCFWRDPTNGAVTSIGAFSTSGTRNFTTPGNNSTGDADWNLVIDSAAAQFRTPGT